MVAMRRCNKRARSSKLSVACYFGVVCLLYHSGCYCQPRFPAGLEDEWTVTGSTIFKFSTRSLRGYKVCPVAAEESCEGYPEDWTVVFNQSYRYVIRSNAFQSNASNVEQNLYTCLYLLKLADGMYLAYQGPTAVNKKYDDFVLTTTELIKLQNTCDLHEAPLPPSRNFLLVKKDLEIVSRFSPFLCPDNIVGKFESDGGAENCQTLLDACTEVGRIFVQNQSCTPKLFDISEENPYITCLFSQRELETDRANMLYVGNKRFSLFSVSLDLHQDTLILKQFKRRGFSQTHDLETFRFILKSPCEENCHFPKIFQGKWFGNRNPTLEVHRSIFTSTKVERTNCSDSRCPTKLSKPSIFESKSIITRHNDFSIFACLTTARFTANKIIYYVTQKDYDKRLESYTSILLNRPALSILKSLCNLQPPYTQSHFGILIKQDKVKESTDKCPDEFSSAYEFHSPKCNFYFVLTKARTQIQVVTKECGEHKPLFSTHGFLICVSNEKINNVTFSILFNLDEQVDYNTTYQFVCLIYTLESSFLKIISVPQTCDERDTFGHPNESRIFYGTAVGAEEVEHFLEPQWTLHDAIYISMLVTGCFIVFSFIGCHKLKEKKDREENFEDDKSAARFLRRRREILDSAECSDMSVYDNDDLIGVDTKMAIKGRYLSGKNMINSTTSSSERNSDESNDDDDDDDEGDSD